jgi:hypothetical protein
MERIFKAKLNMFTAPVVSALKEKKMSGYLQNLINSPEGNDICRWFYFLKFYKYILNDNIYLTKVFESSKAEHSKSFDKQLITAMIEQEN